MINKRAAYARLRVICTLPYTALPGRAVPHLVQHDRRLHVIYMCLAVTAEMCLRKIRAGVLHGGGRFVANTSPSHYFTSYVIYAPENNGSACCLLNRSVLFIYAVYNIFTNAAYDFTLQ